MKLKLLLFLTVLSITGCSLQELRPEDRPAASRAFGVEEAKEFFEKDYMGLLTRSQDSDIQGKGFRGKLHPGDFTPLWDKAVYSESDGVAAYDIDILADRSIIAIRSKFGPNGAKAERLKVYQKLVVRRNVQSGKMASYVLSLIPDVGCDDRRIPERFSSRGKDKGGFSGIAVYTTPDKGEIVRVQEYKDGVLKRGVYLPSGKGSYVDRCRMARDILYGTALMSKRNIMTRAGEDVWEDSWDDDDYSNWDINKLEDCGDGIYTDRNGNYYIDIDYDGDLDLKTLEPGHVEDEESEEPKEPETPNIPVPKPEPKPETGGEEDDEIPEDDGNVGNNPVVNNSIVSAQEMFAASQYSVNKVTERYGPIKAYCNQGVIIAFNQVFPDLQLPNVCANDLVHYWQQHPGNWTLITMQQAIQSADEGYFVVAGWINDKGSGHVAVVMPAETVKGTWNGVYTDVPQVMDTGFERRETCISICRCFGRDKHDNVEFYKFVK